MFFFLLFGSDPSSGTTSGALTKGEWGFTEVAEADKEEEEQADVAFVKLDLLTQVAEEECCQGPRVRVGGHTELDGFL